MPYKFIKANFKLPREKDRRVHLTEADREDIIYRHKQGEGIRSIARIYEKKCTRRLIQFVLFPERLKHQKELFKARRKDGRYKQTKAEWAKTMREHRAYKQSIFIKTKQNEKSNQ